MFTKRADKTLRLGFGRRPRKIPWTIPFDALFRFFEQFPLTILQKSVKINLKNHILFDN